MDDEMKKILFELAWLVTLLDLVTKEKRKNADTLAKEKEEK